VFPITSKWAYLHPQKVPNTLKFWNKDVSKRQEFVELRPKFESRIWRLAAAKQQCLECWHNPASSGRVLWQCLAISAAVWSGPGPVVWPSW